MTTRPSLETVTMVALISLVVACFVLGAIFGHSDLTWYLNH